jgi:hypothetical protein
MSTTRSAKPATQKPKTTKQKDTDRTQTLEDRYNNKAQ